MLTDILTVAQVAVSHIKLFHSTGAGITRMQLAKVVIASVLIFVVHAERLPEGKKYCIIMFADCVRLHIVAAMLNLATVNLLIVVCSQVL